MSQSLLGMGRMEGMGSNESLMRVITSVVED
jgi:hypothetical protein